MALNIPALRHREVHAVDRIGWLRPAVLGANDGIISTASLILGVASSAADRHSILFAGLAGLVAGSLSMAAGEFVSVSSQADTEAASLAREREELRSHPDAEERELALIYVERGLEPELAGQVARQFTARDALRAHARDELGILAITKARPLQAALASAATFSIAAAPVLVAAATPPGLLQPITAAACLLLLSILGALGAYAGGAPPLKASLRVVFWGALAMIFTSAVGRLFGVVV